MKIRTSNLAQIENVENNCKNRFRVESDLRFTMSRKNSYYDARITFLRLDTFEKVTIDFFDQSTATSAKIRFHVKGLICETADDGVCKGLPPYTPVAAAILALDINPNNGSGDKMEYSLKGSYQSIACGKRKVVH